MGEASREGSRSDVVAVRDPISGEQDRLRRQRQRGQRGRRGQPGGP
jgi:hypothetical protein